AFATSQPRSTTKQRPSTWPPRPDRSLRTPPAFFGAALPGRRHRTAISGLTPAAKQALANLRLSSGAPENIICGRAHGAQHFDPWSLLWLIAGDKAFDGGSQ